MIKIGNVQRKQATVIARLIMETMNHECCQWFAGPNHTLEDFHLLITRLVEREDSRYSYLSMLVAIAETNKIVGICVSYDGAKLKELGKVFIDVALEAFGRDLSDMEDETTAGGLYIDLLCVDSSFRERGLTKRLLEATIGKGRKMNLPTRLLVDIGNSQVERLYHYIGFAYMGDSQWGGHKMKHLQKSL